MQGGRAGGLSSRWLSGGAEPLPRALGCPQVWQCGGSMEVLPCSRVAHIERTRKPYNNDIDYYAKRNALRAAEVWMDGFKSHVYMAWNIPMTVSWPSWVGRGWGWAQYLGIASGSSKGAAHPCSVGPPGQLHLRNIISFTKESLFPTAVMLIGCALHHHKSSFTRSYEPLRGCRGGNEERAPPAPPGTHKNPPRPAEASHVSSAGVHGDMMTPCLAHRVCPADE